MKSTWLFMALIVPAAAALAAEAHWDGTWKLDKSRSHFSGDTFTLSKGPNGMLHFSDGGPINYDFRIDGKDYAAHYNRTVAWTAAGPDTWDTVTHVDGRVLATSHRTLSADGKTLTIAWQTTRPDGSVDTETDVYTRVTGTAGLEGRWRSIKVDESAPMTFIIATHPDGTMRWDLPEMQAYVEGKPDGTDLAVHGPTMPPGMTFAFKKMSPRKIAYSTRVNGKPDSAGEQTLAADGKSYTDVSWTAGKEDERQTAVYVRQ